MQTSAPKLTLTPLPLWLKRLLLGILILTLGVALGLWHPEPPPPAPKVVFTGIDGKTTDLQALQGKPVLVTFWATDCHSCVEEIPDLIALYDAYHARGLEIIAVNMYHDLPSHVVEMTRMKQIPYIVALDVQAQHALAFGRILATPTTFVISPDGLMVKQIIGKFNPEQMRGLLEPYLS